MDSRFSFLNGPSLALDYGTVMSSWEKMGGSIFTSEASAGSGVSGAASPQAKFNSSGMPDVNAAASPDVDNMVTLCDLFRPDEVVFNSFDGGNYSGGAGAGSSSWGAVVPGGCHTLPQHFEPATSDMMVPCLEFPSDFIKQEPFLQPQPMPFPHGFMCHPIPMYHHHPMPMCMPSPHAPSPTADEGAGSSVFPSCSMHHSCPHPGFAAHPAQLYPAPPQMHMMYPQQQQAMLFAAPMLSRQPSLQLPLQSLPSALDRTNSGRICTPSALSRTESAAGSGKCAAVAAAYLDSANGAPDGARSRSECLERYRDKKARRPHTKMIRYELRKINADNRPRFKGRFVKKNELVA